MNFLYDNDVKIMFKYTAIFGIISEITILSLIIISGVQGATVGKIVLTLIIGLILLMPIQLFVYKKGLTTMNQKFNISSTKVTLGMLFLTLILYPLIANTIILFIPLIGQVLRLYLEVFYWDVFVLANMKNGTKKFNLSLFRNSLKKHYRFGFKYFAFNFILVLAIIGFIVPIFIMDNIKIILIYGLLGETIALLMNAYLKAAMITYLVKNPTPLYEEEIVEADQY